MEKTFASVTSNGIVVEKFKEIEYTNGILVTMEKTVA